MFTWPIKNLIFVTGAIFSFINTTAQPLLSKSSFQTADSFYFAGDWSNAVKMYEELLEDTSTNSVEWQRLGFAYLNIGQPDNALINFEKAEKNNPSIPMQPFLYSRMAKAYGAKNNREKVIDYLEKAVAAGYYNLKELDTSKEYVPLQSDSKFKELRNKVYNSLYPCVNNPRAREFDFWIGEWDVYVTGTKNYAGHSLIQMISGGCAVLENWDSPNSSGKSINFIDPV